MCLNTTGHCLTLVEPRSPHWQVLHFSLGANSHVNTSLVWHWITLIQDQRCSDEKAEMLQQINYTEGDFSLQDCTWQDWCWHSSTVLWNNQSQNILYLQSWLQWSENVLLFWPTAWPNPFSAARSQHSRVSGGSVICDSFCVQQELYYSTESQLTEAKMVHGGGQWNWSLSASINKWCLHTVTLD